MSEPVNMENLVAVNSYMNAPATCRIIPEKRQEEHGWHEESMEPPAIKQKGLEILAEFRT
jgi:hypothetical protein